MIAKYLSIEVQVIGRGGQLLVFGSEVGFSLIPKSAVCLIKVFMVAGDCASSFFFKIRK